MKLPNFLIIGAAKSATTALWFHLKKHPDIFLSEIKEPSFFAYQNSDFNFKGPGDHEVIKSIIDNFDEYKNLFSKCENENAIGEVSPIYLYKRESAENIKKLIPDVRIIACLRNPAERAFSHYMHKRRDGYEKIKDFKKACGMEERRRNENYAPTWFYIDRGFYYESLKNYYNLLPESRIKVFIYEDFKNNLNALIKEICRFLEVDDSFEPETKNRVNESFIPRNRFLHSLLKYRWNYYKRSKKFIPDRLNRKIIFHLNKLWESNKFKPKLPESTRSELIDFYREDIIKTQDLIKRDLSLWLK